MKLSGSRKQAAENANTVTWDEMRSLLFGVGHLSAQLDGYRLLVPSRLRERISRLRDLPWILSLWTDESIHAVPKCLWEEYIRFLSNLLHPKLSEAVLRRIVIETAVEISFDKVFRCLMPTELAHRAGLGGDHNRVLIAPNEGWIEIWEAQKKERLLAEALSAASKVANFSNLPHVAPDNSVALQCDRRKLPTNCGSKEKDA